MDKPITVTIRSPKCISYLRERKSHSISFSATITDILLDYLERKENKRKPHIHVYTSSDGRPTTQATGPPKFEGKIPIGSKPVISMSAIHEELKQIFNGDKKLQKVPKSELRHVINK